jgi:molybdate transport system regulatory protein
MNDRLEPRIRILLGSSIAIGPGKAALLEAIGETGSIAALGGGWG